uniref:Uncharacterized protein n=1 Tax=Romanomermis culicivorax TaxID=13658 RepID=A0A915HQI9_ROMCU
MSGDSKHGQIFPGLFIRVSVVIVKLLTCLCYVARVVNDPGPEYAKCYGCLGHNFTDVDKIDKAEYLENPVINYMALVWVHRPFELWMIQIVLSALSLIRTAFLMYLWYKLLSTKLRNLFLPMFLNCWIAKIALENLLHDLHRAMQKSQSAVTQHLIVLASTIFCLVFTA